MFVYHTIKWKLFYSEVYISFRLFCGPRRVWRKKAKNGSITAGWHATDRPPSISFNLSHNRDHPVTHEVYTEIKDLNTLLVSELSNIALRRNPPIAWTKEPLLAEASDYVVQLSYRLAAQSRRRLTAKNDHEFAVKRHTM